MHAARSNAGPERQVAGLVIRLHRKGCTVEIEGGTAECKRVRGEDLCVGDEVRLALPARGRPTIVERAERRTWFGRPVQGGRRTKLVAANVDYLTIVMAAAEPDPVPGLIDRFMVLGRRGGLRPLLCMNKMDLADRAAIESLLDPYERLDVPVHRLCALTGEGVEPLRHTLAGKRSLFCGYSGVGKSTLINALTGSHVRLRTGEISEATGKGRHTTAWVDWIELDDGTVVIDTPGLRQLSLAGLTAEEIEAGFPEIHRYASDCHFQDCHHQEEPDCAVRTAVERGEIAPERYARYRAILENP